MSRGEVTRRTVHPLALVYYTDHWNLIAFDLLRNGIRNFRLDHILTMRVLSERFEPPADFDLREYLEERAAPDDMIDVKLRFSATAYRLARTRIPARVVEEVEDENEVEVAFQIESLKFLARWMLSFGGEVRVVEPDRLRRLVREEAERILQANTK